MIRLVAVSTTVISGVFMGEALRKAERDTLKEAEALYELIAFIKREIEQRSLPLGVIFSSYLSEKRHPLIENALRFVRGSYGDKILFMIRTVCSEKTCSELEAFAHTLGALDRDSQKEALKKALLSMEKELTDRRAECSSKCRLYSSLSLLVSCIVAVLLY